MPVKPPSPLPSTSRFELELLSRAHDREGFSSGLESVDDYLKRTARGHAEKDVSRTWVLVEAAALPPKNIWGYFTLTATCAADAGEWPRAPKGLPRQAVPLVLLGRLAVALAAQGMGIGSMLVAAAQQLAAETIARIGGIGLVVDAANEDVVAFYERFGFRRTARDAMRLFLPTASLGSAPIIPRMA